MDGDASLRVILAVPNNTMNAGDYTAPYRYIIDSEAEDITADRDNYINYTYTVWDTKRNPVQGALVEVTTDSPTQMPALNARPGEGRNVIGSSFSNEYGIVVFNLRRGEDYYFWTTRDGYNFNNPDTERVPA